jgi:hypothetical protein
MTDDPRRLSDPVLLAQLADLASAMLGTQGSAVTPARLTDFAARAVPHADAVSLTYIRGSNAPQTLAGTDSLAYEIDAIQYEAGEGPCLDAIAEHDVTRSNDLAVDPQWPTFGPRAARAGAGSSFGVRLFLDGDQRGALNFFARNTYAFTDVDIATGALFAIYASQALEATAQRDKAAHLEVALLSNRQIGMATGILMARNQWTAEQAFDNLRAASQRLHRKLRDIAEEVAFTGELPAPPGGRRTDA